MVFKRINIHKVYKVFGVKKQLVPRQFRVDIARYCSNAHTQSTIPNEFNLEQVNNFLCLCGCTISKHLNRSHNDKMIRSALTDVQILTKTSTKQKKTTGLNKNTFSKHARIQLSRRDNNNRLARSRLNKRAHAK